MKYKFINAFINIFPNLVSRSSRGYWPPRAIIMLPTGSSLCSHFLCHLDHRAKSEVLENDHPDHIIAEVEAEGIEVPWNEEEWNILCNMGEGVKAGMERCGLSSFSEAVRLCDLISSATGERYKLDSLASFLCLGSRSTSSTSHESELQWPERGG